MSDTDYSEIAIQFWRYLAAGEWNDASELLSVQIEVVWHQTRELIKGHDKYMDILRHFLGAFELQIISSHHEYDKWDDIDHVTLEVMIDQTLPDGEKKRSFCIGVYDIQEDTETGSPVIIGATQYWAEAHVPPEWRKGLTERY